MTFERRVGFVSLSAFGALLVTTALLGDWDLHAKHYAIQASFENGGGLKEGHAVLLAGVVIGKVQAIRFEGDCVVAVLQVRHGYDIPGNANVEILSASAFGGREVTITPPRGTPAGPPCPKDGSAWIHESRSHNLLQDFSELSEESTRAAHSFNEIIHHVRGGDGTLGSLLYDEKMSSRIRAVVHETADFAEALRYGDGTVAAFLDPPGKREAISSALERFNEVAAAIDREALAVDRRDGALGELLRDDAILRDLERIASATRDMARKADEGGSGALAALLNDTPLHRRWDEAMAHLNSIQGKITRPPAAPAQQ